MPTVPCPPTPNRSRAVLAGTLLAAAALAAAPVAAQTYAARTLGAWTVRASGDASGCFVTRDYGGSGETTLLFGLDTAGENHVTLLNRDWSIKPKDRVELDFRLSNATYPRHFAVGLASNGKQGFVSSFDAAFPARLAGSRFLNIDRAGVPVERLPLDGSAAAIAELRRCVDAFRADSGGGAGQGGRSARVPKDPFAPPADRTRRN